MRRPIDLLLELRDWQLPVWACKSVQRISSQIFVVLHVTVNAARTPAPADTLEVASIGHSDLLATPDIPARDCDDCVSPSSSHFVEAGR